MVSGCGFVAYDEMAVLPALVLLQCSTNIPTKFVSSFSPVLL
jgi:hypothetical protein